MSSQPKRPAAAEPLLPQQQQQAAPPGAEADDQPGDAPYRRLRSFPWLILLGFLFLTVNSIMAIYRSQGDRGAVAFVCFSYLDLVVLFVCLRSYERAAPGSLHRDRLKIVVWVLTTALTLLFSYKVAALMPFAVALVVWIMAFGTVAGGFLAFFCYGSKH
uniref:Uncharacterized protein n=1 Tax=Arundo donax TaxID=35708 RepID=A0A0A8YN18_ARUDO